MNIYTCGECKGKGYLIIENAYNPEDKQKVDCDYCDGEGVVNPDDLGLAFVPVKRQSKKADRDLLN